jgi:hypothetical protein
MKDFGENESKQNMPLTTRLARPSYEDTPLVRVVPTKAPTLKIPTPASEYGSGSNGNSGEIKEGESCKNGGCKVVSFN